MRNTTAPTTTMSDAERKELNRRMYDWWNGIVRCADDDCECGEFNAWEV